MHSLLLDRNARLFIIIILYIKAFLIIELLNMSVCEIEMFLSRMTEVLHTVNMNWRMECVRSIFRTSLSTHASGIFGGAQCIRLKWVHMHCVMQIEFSPFTFECVLMGIGGELFGGYVYFRRNNNKSAKTSDDCFS